MPVAGHCFAEFYILKPFPRRFSPTSNLWAQNGLHFANFSSSAARDPTHRKPFALVLVPEWTPSKRESTFQENTYSITGSHAVSIRNEQQFVSECHTLLYRGLAHSFGATRISFKQTTSQEFAEAETVLSADKASSSYWLPACMEQTGGGFGHPCTAPRAY